jgi:hypothetical protein
MANEYLLPRIHNGNHHASCFCTCRRQKVADYLHGGDSTTRELEDAFLSEMDEYRILDELFTVTKERIIRGEVFLQHCLRNTEYVSFGAWMNTQERYVNMTDQMKRKIRRNVNTVHSVYTNWETIVENLTDVDILHIDARKLSINQLYQAISPEWCSDHDESLRDPGDVPGELEYGEQKYIQVLISIRNVGLLGDVQYDRRKTSIIGRRLQRDLGKMSKIGREINE